MAGFFGSAEFYTYEMTKSYMKEFTGHTELNHSQKMICGSLSGIAAGLFVMPLTVLKTNYVMA